VLLPQGDDHVQQQQQQQQHLPGQEQQQVCAAADADDAQFSNEDEAEGSDEGTPDAPSEEGVEEQTMEEFLAGEHEVFTAEDLQQQDQQQQQQQEDASSAAAAAASATPLAGSSSPQGPGAAGWQSSVACVTADYAMQNVLLQMGLRLLTRDGRRIARLSRCGGPGGGAGRGGCGTSPVVTCLDWPNLHKHNAASRCLVAATACCRFVTSGVTDMSCDVICVSQVRPALLCLLHCDEGGGSAVLPEVRQPEPGPGGGGGGTKWCRILWGQEAPHPEGDQVLTAQASGELVGGRSTATHSCTDMHCYLLILTHELVGVMDRQRSRVKTVSR
jgi:rRNA maturation endonuclease Nob1